MKIFSFIGTICFLVLLPSITNATVIFSEIAWMGTETNANDEWIEIYNFSSSPTDITNWTITDTNSLSITLTGVMPPHGVFLLERTDDDTVPSVAASVIYTGALTNSGTTLTIKDSGGNIIGTPLVGGDNWVNIGGNNDLKYTAQLTMSGTWVTGTPTPGAPNIEENTAVPNTNASTKSSGGGGGPVKRVVEPKVVLSEIDHTLALEIHSPEIVYVNQPVELAFTASGAGKTLMNSLDIYWNFGDTYTSNEREPRHTYTHPGTYVAVLEGEFGEQYALAQAEITVLPVGIEISVTEDGAVVLKNTSVYDMDLGGFTLTGDIKFIFPKHTVVKSKKSITIPSGRIEMRKGMVSLFDLSGAIVTSYADTPGVVLGASKKPNSVAYVNNAPPSNPVVVETEPTVKPQVDKKVITIGDDTSPRTENSSIFSRLVSKLIVFFSG